MFTQTVIKDIDNYRQMNDYGYKKLAIPMQEPDDTVIRYILKNRAS